MKALAHPTQIRDVFDPITLQNCLEARLSRSRMKRLRSVSSFEYYNARVAARVLKEPEAIFWGIDPKNRREYGWCYVGRPKRLWLGLNPMDSMPFPNGFVFTAYLDDRNNLFDWELEPASPQAPDLPHDYLSGRFGDLKWRKTT